MYEFAPALGQALDQAQRPVVRFLHERLGLTPAHITWAAFLVSAVAGLGVAMNQVGTGLLLMAFGQVLDGLDGTMARQYKLVSDKGRRLDENLDRASEGVIFLGFAASGLVPLREVLFAYSAILLLTTIAHRSKWDPGMKRFALYFGLLFAWKPFFSWINIFRIIASVNLALYVIGLLKIDCDFQVKMDQVGGDLDTVASRTIDLDLSGKL